MRDLEGRAAFVTGAGAGIGLGIARALARERVDLAIADIEAEPLEAARAELEQTGVKVHAVQLDVAQRTAVYAAATAAEEALGRIDILVNNAGVGYAGTPLDEIPDTDYDWVLSVNLFGVINGIKAFVPLIKRHGGGGHVVNTASIGGFQVKPGWHHGLYAASKYAVVALSEGLREDLAPAGIGVSVVAPAGVATNLFQAGRNRPAEYGGPFRRPEDHPVGKLAQDGLDPDVVGRDVVAGIKDDQLYIFTHPATRTWLEERHRGMMDAYDWAERALEDANQRKGA